MKKKAEYIDCVKMKNDIQEKTRAEVKGMSPAEENAYREKRIAASSLGPLWAKLKAKSKKAAV